MAVSSKHRGWLNRKNNGILAAVYNGAQEGASVLTTNTALDGVLVGTPVTPALAVDSVVISNMVASGDVLVAANNGGNSQAWLWVDSSGGTMTLYGAGTAALTISATAVKSSLAVSPLASDGAALGSATLMWSDLFLASGAVINFNNGNVTITHGAGTLTVDGAAVVFNEASGDLDFRIESNGNANMFALDAGLDAIGIGGAAVTAQTLTVTNAALDPVAGRAIKIAGTMAAPNMADGYGVFEVDVTVTGTMGATGFVNATSAWVNIPSGMTVGAGQYVCARNDGVYEDAGATITNAKIVFGARLHKLLGDTDALSFPWSINTNNSAITALIDVNNLTDLGTVANAGATAATLLPICRDAGGTLKYVLLYNLA